ncbi:hypothetical protein TWF481_000146 [Arthrobotrys musiformis]|uniref:F-box domain-containing protein n=1 Tax=Arthrobotrys musiformis TaxID=47236 RepID=A0AAV9WNC2_9PEZI
MIIFYGFGSTNLRTTLQPGLTSPSARMGLLPDLARFRRKPCITTSPLASLPTEIILQIVESDVLTPWDRVCFAATCGRFKSIVYPCLYRRFDWVMPFHASCVMGLSGGFGMLLEILLEPVVSGISMMFGLWPPADGHLNSFRRRAGFVREMSVLGGYQYYKDMDVITRYYGVMDDGDPFISLFEPFQNLRSIEFDERAAVSWTGYLRVVASILVSKPALEELTLRHRLAAQPDVICGVPADMTDVERILSKGVVSKLRSLTVILGRKFEATEMGYEYFHQLVGVFEHATDEVTAFKLFASYSKLDETDPILLDGVRGKNGVISPVKKWSLPKLQEVEIHAHNFPGTGAIQSIDQVGLGSARELKVACDIMNTDFEALSENLSSFENIEELSIWDPQYLDAREYTQEELLPICEKFGVLKRGLERLNSVHWDLGYQKSTMRCSIEYPPDGRISEPAVSFARSIGRASLEKIIPSLPEPVRYIKRGYIATRA